MAKKSVCIVGSGNWGSAIAKIIGVNVLKKCDQFEKRVNMYMYEEFIDGQKLTEIVNTKHENVKYLPGIQIPDNVVAIPDVVQACTGADILVFVLPHQFVKGVCNSMKGHVKDSAISISLIKGMSLTDAGMKLISEVIQDELNIPCLVMMGANLAQEVAQEQLCEATIGCEDEEHGLLMKELFASPYFRCTAVTDKKTVELCGALKNVVGIGAGIVDGLNYGDNTKAAVIRLGLMEMIKFAEEFFPGGNTATFFESCGIADLVATCHGGRNRLLGENVVKSDKTVKQLEKEILRGQSFQGPRIGREVYKMLESKDMVDRFPLFTAVHRICERVMDPRDFIQCLRNHPEHM